jgi:hypothetical protein
VLRGDVYRFKVSKGATRQPLRNRGASERVPAPHRRDRGTDLDQRRPRGVVPARGRTRRTEDPCPRRAARRRRCIPSRRRLWAPQPRRALGRRRSPRDRPRAPLTRRRAHRSHAPISSSAVQPTRRATMPPAAAPAGSGAPRSCPGSPGGDGFEPADPFLQLVLVGDVDAIVTSGAEQRLGQTEVDASQWRRRSRRWPTPSPPTGQRQTTSLGPVAPSRPGRL